MKRSIALLLTLAVVSMAATPAMATAAAGSASVDGTTVFQQNGTATPTNESNETVVVRDGNSSDGNATQNESTAPTQAETVRINPIRFDESFLSTEVREADKAFNTTGPFALFGTTERVESVRISQAPASARVLEGGHQVRVIYEDDAAPRGESSLYKLELFFEDGSSKTVDLYASDTSVSVAAAELEDYRPVLNDLEDIAEEWGYETDPESLQNFLEFINDRASLVDGWLTQKAAQLLMALSGLARNWLAWVFGLFGLALVGRWLTRKYGGILEVLENDPGKAKRKRDQLEVAYREHKQSADEEPLKDVDEIGSNHVYWTTAFGVRSPAQLANLAVRGLHRRTKDGELEQVHGGVEELEPENIRRSWLEPVLRENRIPVPRQALAEMKAACEYMETNYSMGHVYRDARDELESLINEIDRKHQSMPDSSGNYAEADD